METFAKLFERFLVFVYHCFDRIVIQGHLPLLTCSAANPNDLTVRPSGNSCGISGKRLSSLDGA